MQIVLSQMDVDDVVDTVIDYESFKVAINKLSELRRTLNEVNAMTHYIESAKEELKKDYAR